MSPEGGLGPAGACTHSDLGEGRPAGWQAGALTSHFYMYPFLLLFWVAFVLFLYPYIWDT